MRLYDLTAEYVHLLQLADESDEDFSDALDALEDDLEAKADNVASVVKTLEMQGAAAKAEGKRLTARGKSYEGQAKTARMRLLGFMDAAGKPKLSGDRFTVSAKDVKAKIVVADESRVPRAFTSQETVTKIDKEAAKAALDAFATTGEVVDGVEVHEHEDGSLHASIPGLDLVRGRTLQIR